MDQPIPEQPPAPEPDPETDPSPDAKPAPKRDPAIDVRLRAMVDAHEARDRVIAWARGWVSREVRFHTLLAARTLDFAVVTDHYLLLFSTGFFSRRPRRLVFEARLDEIAASRVAVPGGRRLRIASAEGKPLWIEMRASQRGRIFAATVIARARAEQR